MRLPSVAKIIQPGPRLRIFAALTIASAAVVSFDSIKHLAEYAGFGKLSWLFPLTLDAVAAFGMDLWVRRSPAWKHARALALAAILGSLVANIADHWISQRTILPAVLGAVPPAMLAALLAVLHRHGAGTAQTVRSGPDTAVRDAVWRSLAQAQPGPVRGPAFYVVPDRVMSLDRAAPLHGPSIGPMVRDRNAFADRVRAEKLAHAVREDQPVQLRAVPVRKVRPPTVRRSDGPTDDVIVKAIKDHAAYQSGRLPTKRDVMAEHGVGSGRALKLLALAKETQEKVATDG